MAVILCCATFFLNMNWIDIKEKKPKRYQYVLVETKYCKYPATVAIWNGVFFKSVDNVTIGNSENIFWAEITDTPECRDVENETDFFHLKQAIEQIDESFVSVRRMKNADENVSMIFEGIGFNRSCLIDELKKIEK